jgi:uncharacterized protein YdeI (YjbR/CyaY-like superfamily)
MRPSFFTTAAELRAWFKIHHANTSELLIGFHKKASGRPSVTYHEALDEALSVGWIDGVRKSIGDESYTIRFTPRRTGSYWSRVNTARAKALIDANRMTPAGMQAFEARDATKTAKYSFERDAPAFAPSQLRLFKRNRKAWTFFQAQPPGYRKLATFWVVSAKRDDTRTSRLNTLIALSGGERRLQMLSPSKQR